MSFNIVRIGLGILDLMTTQIYKHFELDPFICEIYNFGDRKIIGIRTIFMDKSVIKIIKTDEEERTIHTFTPFKFIKLDDVLPDGIENYDDTELLYLLGKKYTDDNFDDYQILTQILIELRNKL